MTEDDDFEAHTVRRFLYPDGDADVRRLEFRIAAESGQVRISFGPAHEDHPASYTMPAEVAAAATGWLAEDLRRVVPYAMKLATIG